MANTEDTAGSRVSVVIIGAEDLDASPGFYADTLGLDLPGRGKCRSMLAHNPGSGALQELFQPIPSG